MAKNASAVIRTTTSMRATKVKAAKPTGSSEDDDFTFGWEQTAHDPLIYIAREIVDNAWPDTPTPDVMAGTWDNTPIMKCVLVALRRGIELAQKDDE